MVGWLEGIPSLIATALVSRCVPSPHRSVAGVQNCDRRLGPVRIKNIFYDNVFRSTFRYWEKGLKLQYPFFGSMACCVVCLRSTLRPFHQTSKNMMFVFCVCLNDMTVGSLRAEIRDTQCNNVLKLFEVRYTWLNSQGFALVTLNTRRSTLIFTSSKHSIWHSPPHPRRHPADFDSHLRTSISVSKQDTEEKCECIKTHG